MGVEQVHVQLASVGPEPVVRGVGKALLLERPDENCVRHHRRVVGLLQLGELLFRVD